MAIISPSSSVETLPDSADKVAHLSSLYSEEAYHGLVAYGRQNVHGDRFGFRDYDPSIPAFMLKNSLLEAQPGTEKMALIKEIFVPQFTHNPEEIIGEISRVVDSPVVASHQARGGSLLLATPHITYEGEPMVITARTLKKLDTGQSIEAIAPRQNIVTGRLIGLFALHGFSVYDTLLLPQMNIVQILPATQSGKADLQPPVRKVFAKLGNESVKARLMAPQNETVMAMSGTQDEHNKKSQTFTLARVKNELATMITDINTDPQTANRLMVVPVFIRNQALVGRQRLKPDVTDIAVGEPVIPRSKEAIHDVMRAIVELGNTSLSRSLHPDAKGHRLIYGRNRLRRT